MDMEQVAVQIQKVVDLASRNEGRIKKLENENQVLHQLATSVAVMAEQMKGLNKNVTALADEVEEIKEKPGKRYDTIVTAIITGLVGALIGYFMSGLL